jgi:hypothetical protein
MVRRTNFLLMNAKVKETARLQAVNMISVKKARRFVNVHLMDQEQEYVIFVLFKTWTLPADRVQMTVTATPKLDMKCPLTQLDQDFMNVTEPRTNSPSTSVKVINVAAQQQFVLKMTVKFTRRGASAFRMERESVLFASTIISL